MDCCSSHATETFYCLMLHTVNVKHIKKTKNTRIAMAIFFYTIYRALKLQHRPALSLAADPFTCSLNYLTRHMGAGATRLVATREYDN